MQLYKMPRRIKPTYHERLQETLRRRNQPPSTVAMMRATPVQEMERRRRFAAGVKRTRYLKMLSKTPLFILERMIKAVQRACAQEIAAQAALQDN